MTITVDYKRSLLGKSIDAKLRRMRDLRPADNDAQRAVVRRNRGIAFKPTHRLSHLVVQNGHVELGSYAPGYFKLLSLDGERLAVIYADWIVNGNSRKGF